MKKYLITAICLYCSFLSADNIEIYAQKKSAEVYKNCKSSKRRCCGSQSLREKIAYVKPLYNTFGHIHENAGRQLYFEYSKNLRVNASQMDEDYEFHNRPFDFELEKK